MVGIAVGSRNRVVAIEKLLRPQSPFDGLAAEIGPMGPLIFAALFHDAGKGSPDEGHVDASARLVATAMSRIGTPAPERDTVLFLIRSHLVLSFAMQTRDVSRTRKPFRKRRPAWRPWSGCRR